MGYLTGEIIKRHSGSIFRERRVGRSSTDFSRKDLAFLERNNIDATTRAKPLPLVQAPTLAPIEIFDLRRRRITGPSWIGAAEVKIAEALKGKATAGSGWSQEALGAGLKAVQEASAHHPGQLHAAVVLLDNTVDAIKGCVPELTGSQSGTTALQTVQTLIDRKDYISAIIQSAEGWRAHGGRQFLDLLQAAVFRFSTQGLG